MNAKPGTEKPIFHMSPSACLFIILDGLGDRQYPELDGQTPLHAAHTPNLDRLAHLGGNGLYHAGRLGEPFPSESAHFALFGYPQALFPGRGPLEALGAGVDLHEGDVVNALEKAKLQGIRESAEERLFWPGSAPGLALDDQNSCPEMDSG